MIAVRDAANLRKPITLFLETTTAKEDFPFARNRVAAIAPHRFSLRRQHHAVHPDIRPETRPRWSTVIGT